MEVTILTYGDSNDINLWSNLPYFIAKACEENVGKTNRFDVYYPQRKIKFLFDKTIRRIVKVFKRKTTYCYERSIIHHIVCMRLMKRAVKNYPNTDLFICLSFSWNTSRYSTKPCINLCDWTYEFLIKQDIKKTVDWFEHHEIERQKRVLESSTLCDVWRIECKNLIRQSMPCVNLTVEHSKAVNCLYDISSLQADYIENKYTSNVYVFIGAQRYIEGARVFCEVMNDFNNKGYDFKAYLIGINESALNKERKLHKNIKCVGYLDKGDMENCNVYYELIKSSKVVINTNSDFVSLAGIIESQYLYTPAIISKNYQTISEYGEKLCSGWYCNNTVKELHDMIMYVNSIDYDEYKNTCQYAHNIYHNATYDKYVQSIIKQCYLIK